MRSSTLRANTYSGPTPGPGPNEGTSSTSENRGRIEARPGRWSMTSGGGLHGQPRQFRDPNLIRAQVRGRADPGGPAHQVAEHAAQEEHRGQGDRLGPDRSVSVVGGPAPRFVHGWAREYPIRGGGCL